MKQEEKIKAAITSLIDSVETFFGVAPLRFLDVDGGNDDIGCLTFPGEYETRFHRFESWFQYLLETLSPYYGEDEEKSRAAEKIIAAALPEDPDVKKAWCEFYDATTSLMFPARHVGFYVGVFVGAKGQGARRKDLVKIGKALLLPCLQQWQVTQSKAEADKAKKEKPYRKGKRPHGGVFKLLKGGKKASGPETLKGEFNA